MRITISDDLGDQILQALPTRGLLDDVAGRILSKGIPLVDEAAFVIDKESAGQLAHVLNTPQVSSGKQLVTACQQLADLKIGQVRLKLPPAVLAGLRDRATREGRPLSELMQWAIDELSQNLARFA